jgi:Lrp/AsnC family leucine-responsive transcriptional regulator
MSATAAIKQFAWLVRDTGEMRSRSFEREIAKCPDVVSCYLSSGNDDYLGHVQARDMEITSASTSSISSGCVAWLQSSFAMRSIVRQSISSAALGN